ncbi:hypothetical protein BGZ65_000758, partial [Modicella reniformis]
MHQTASSPVAVKPFTAESEPPPPYPGPTNLHDSYLHLRGPVPDIEIKRIPLDSTPASHFQPRGSGSGSGSGS